MITLHTVLYDGNFESLLTDNCWFFKFKSDYITNRLITINNITKTDKFNEKLTEMKHKYKFDIVYVSDNKDSTNDIFGVNINEKTLGYYYTMAYFVGINNIDTEFILNVSSDCMDDISIDDDYLKASIIELRDNPSCSTTMVAWTKDNYTMANGLKVGEYENIETFKHLNKDFVEGKLFNYTFNFTDQFFMGDVSKLKKINYKIDESISNLIYNGPSYGGNSFEKRMVGHQIQNNVYNCVFKGNQYYIHDKNYY